MDLLLQLPRRDREEGKMEREANAASISGARARTSTYRMYFVLRTRRLLANDDTPILAAAAIFFATLCTLYSVGVGRTRSKYSVRILPWLLSARNPLVQSSTDPHCGCEDIVQVSPTRGGGGAAVPHPMPRGDDSCAVAFCLTLLCTC